jgi:Tfp pilus assembly protein PilZ
MVREYTENLKKGGCFVKTPRPLAVGRQVLVEVRVAAISDDPICIDGVVTWSSRDLDILGDGEVPGMGIEYQIGGAEVREIQARLQGLLAT